MRAPHHAQESVTAERTALLQCLCNGHGMHTSAPRDEMGLPRKANARGHNMTSTAGACGTSQRDWPLQRECHTRPHLRLVREVARPVLAGVPQCAQEGLVSGRVALMKGLGKAECHSAYGWSS